MDTATRDELIDTYYDAIDAEAFERFERAFAPDIEYLYPGEPVMHGVAEVQTFFEERRGHSGSTHEVHRRVSDREVTVCEGRVTAERPDGTPFDAGFVGVFTFDDVADGIDRIAVYTRT